MLIFHDSNKTENLAAAMAHIMATHPLSDPFEQELILIQSAGMGTWLNQQLALHNGAAVNVSSVHPASFIWQLIRTLQPALVQTRHYEKSTLRWEILRLLPEKLEQPDYAPLARYLSSLGNPATSTSAQMMLAEAAADIFDAYQNYRPDWIRRWEATAGPASVPDELAHVPGASSAWAWQRDLWRSLYPEQPLEARQHRAAQIEWLAQALRSLDLDQQSQLPQRVFVFGLHTLPPAWLPLYLQLAQYIDIHWLAMNPCQHYWGDVLHPQQALRQQHTLLEKGIDASLAGALFVEQNRLLASWGKTGRDYLSLIHEREGTPGFVVSSADLFDTPDANTSALQAIQADIFDVAQQRRPIALDDASIRFAQCHSRLREVEALHDYVLGLLASDTDLAPRDIIVMMPDVEVFAPLIRAIFSRRVRFRDGEQRALPFAISDQAIAREQPLIDALDGVFRLGDTRLSMFEVFDWLDTDAIRQRFQLEEPDCVTLRAWLSQLNVRWGLSGEHRDELLQHQGSSDANTWFKAMRRMLAGMVSGSPEAGADLHPYARSGLPSEPDAIAQQVLVGKMCRFLDVLSALKQALRRDLPPSQGLLELSHWVHRLVDWETLDETGRQLLQSSLDTLGEQFTAQKLASIPLQMLADAWLEGLQESRVSQRFLSGSINFCTLMPMRSIPFKVVAMLGMNEGAFPRQQIPNTLDLMQHDAPRPGDRSRRDDDRYLFLEALCSARQALYISYEGFSAQDNSERFPSVLVSELREYCGQNFYLETDATAADAESAKRLLSHWTATHRLQPFHPMYFSDSSGFAGLPHSFAAEWLDYLQTESACLEGREQQQAIASQPVVHDATQRYTLDALIQLVQNPLRHYYQRLGVSLAPVPEHDPESEPFVLDGLARYAMKKDVAQTWFDPSQESEQVLYRWQALDRLPRAPWDRAEFDASEQSLAAQRVMLEEYHALRAHDLHYEHRHARMEGQVWCAREARVELNFSKSMSGAFWGAWCRHVFWSCDVAREHHTGESHCIGTASMLVMKPLEQGLAQRYASELLDFAQAVALAPYCFAPRTLYHLVMQREAKARQDFLGASGRYEIRGERDDPYWQRYESEHGVCVDTLLELEQRVQAHPLWQQVHAMRDLIEERDV